MMQEIIQTVVKRDHHAARRKRTRVKAGKSLVQRKNRRFHLPQAFEPVPELCWGDIQMRQPFVLIIERKPVITED